PGGSTCRLSDEQITALEAALDAGLAAHGWTDDQRWTLARITTVIKELFGVSYTLRGTSYLLHRIGWSPQHPVRRAAERDEHAVTTWVTALPARAPAGCLWPAWSASSPAGGAG
uniref:helix-turn-helix domain-containing protein n=1 Tax=Sphaerimonospora mesophila TaxID=37483 RepID=UPI000AFFE1D2